jgi:hypothetical protein
MRAVCATWPLILAIEAVNSSAPEASDSTLPLACAAAPATVSACRSF